MAFRRLARSPVRLLVATLLALAGTALVFGAVAGAGALAGEWSGRVAFEQGAGLAIHGAVVFARGLLPNLVLTALLAALAVRLGRAPGFALRAGLALVAAAAVVPLVLTSEVGDWPRLRTSGPADAILTALLLALASAAALHLAERLVTRPRRA